MDNDPRVFVSYSRADLDYVRELCEDLGKAGIAVWYDLREIGAGQWWSQIEDALTGSSAVEHVVLVVSPRALDRPTILREWRVARREGKMVSPVIPPHHKQAFDFAKLPRWVKAQHFFDLSAPEQRLKLIKVLRGAGQQPRRPMMAPPLPDDFVHRATEFESLKSQMLDSTGEAVAIVAGLRGAGGFGKTVLASALARDEEVQDAFYDGVLWVTLGQQADIAQQVQDLIHQLTNTRLDMLDLHAATWRLREVLEHRRCLIVIDDIWWEEQLRPFLNLLPTTSLLITTRRDDILPANTMRMVVDAMTDGEATSLLGFGLSILPAQRAALAKLATDRLGEWPILLSLVNRFLRTRLRRGETLDSAIGGVSERLNRRGINAFNLTFEKDRVAAIDSTVEASLDLLVEFDRLERPFGWHSARYTELAVFPEDVEIPITIIKRLWYATDSVGEDEAHELLERLYGLALLQNLDLKARSVRLHDVMRLYLCEKIRDRGRFEALHGQLATIGLCVARGSVLEHWQANSETSYWRRHLLDHLGTAKSWREIETCFLEPSISKAIYPIDIQYANDSALVDAINRQLRTVINLLPDGERSKVVGSMIAGHAVRAREILYDFILRGGDVNERLLLYMKTDHADWEIMRDYFYCFVFFCTQIGTLAKAHDDGKAILSTMKDLHAYLKHIMRGNIKGLSARLAYEADVANDTWEPFCL